MQETKSLTIVIKKCGKLFLFKKIVATQVATKKREE